MVFTGSSASRGAAMMGCAAFLAPEILISPLWGPPPVMINLSMLVHLGHELRQRARLSLNAGTRKPASGLALFLLPLRLGIRAYRQGVNVAAHLVSKGGVYHALLFQQALASRGVGDP